MIIYIYIYKRTLVFLISFSFLAALALAIASSRALARTWVDWFLRALIAAKSAPTIPLWCLIVFLVRFFATVSVKPFLCRRRYKTVHAILRGFFRWRKRDSVLGPAKRKTYHPNPIYNTKSKREKKGPRKRQMVKFGRDEYELKCTFESPRTKRRPLPG